MNSATSAVHSPGERPAPAAIAPLVVTEAEAAQLLRLSPRSLQRLRLDGGGPPFCRLSERRIGYAVSELNRWLAARSAASTSDATTQKARGG